MTKTKPTNSGECQQHILKVDRVSSAGITSASIFDLPPLSV